MKILEVINESVEEQLNTHMRQASELMAQLRQNGLEDDASELLSRVDEFNEIFEYLTDPQYDGTLPDNATHYNDVDGMYNLIQDIQKTLAEYRQILQTMGS
jgi:hypothetical protein